MTILSKLIQFYNQSKLQVIEFITDSKENIFYENGFLDDTDVLEQVNIIKENIAKIDSEINMAVSNKNDINLQNLIITRENEIINLVFLASNRLEYIDSLIQIANKNSKFFNCLLALQYYKHGNKQKACKLLECWLQDKRCFENHFLLNYIFSELIFDKDISKAYDCLQEAVKLRPENKIVHERLLQIYRSLNNSVGINSENEILNLLR